MSCRQKPFSSSFPFIFPQSPRPLLFFYIYNVDDQLGTHNKVYCQLFAVECWDLNLRLSAYQTNVLPPSWIPTLPLTIWSGPLVSNTPSLLRSSSLGSLGRTLKLWSKQPFIHLFLKLLISTASLTISVNAGTTCKQSHSIFNLLCMTYSLSTLSS